MTRNACLGLALLTLLFSSFTSSFTLHAKITPPFTFIIHAVDSKNTVTGPLEAYISFSESRSMKSSPFLTKPTSPVENRGELAIITNSIEKTVKICATSPGSKECTASLKSTNQVLKTRLISATAPHANFRSWAWSTDLPKTLKGDHDLGSIAREDTLVAMQFLLVGVVMVVNFFMMRMGDVKEAGENISMF